MRSLRVTAVLRSRVNGNIADRDRSLVATRSHCPGELERVLMRNLLASDERVFFKDLRGRFLAVSQGWLAGPGQGRQPEEVIGRTAADIFTEPHALAAAADEQQIVRTGRPMLRRIERQPV